MSDHYLRYLEREHARLEAEIRDEECRPFRRQFLIRRLKKLKLPVKDQMVAFCKPELPHGRTGSPRPKIDTDRVEARFRPHPPSETIPPAACAEQARPAISMNAG